MISVWILVTRFLFVCLCIRHSLGNDKNSKDDICMTAYCKHVVSEDSVVLHHCNHDNLTMYGRCCLKPIIHENLTLQQQHHNEFLISGIDFSSCDTDINEHEHNSTIIYSKAHLKYLMLEGNTKISCEDKTFDGMGNLKYLSLPPGCNCPGLNDTAWHKVIRSPNMTMCFHAINLCKEGVPQNYTCPNNQSVCSMYAPGNPWCVCKEGYHGYKCLRSGDFPFIIFAVASLGGTALVSAFLWATQRRHVKYQ